MKLSVAIATSSSDKIEGVRSAISRFFFLEESEMEVSSKAVDSGVSEQPFGDETYEGALNRVNNIRQEFPKKDFYISCEAGIENAFGQYFNVQVVCIYDSKSERFFWGKSAGWSIPNDDIEEIRQTNLDVYLRKKGISSIDELLGATHSRSEAISEAVELALASRRL